MKKLFSVALIVVMLVACLSACNFTQNVSGVGSAEATPMVEEMLSALSGGRVEDAKALMLSGTETDKDRGIQQMCAYLDGREAQLIEQISINVKTSFGASGSIRQESVGYCVTLNDGDVIYLSVGYITENGESGFNSFQLVLGVV